MSSLERRIANFTTNSPLDLASEGNGTPIPNGEIKQRLSFRQVVLIAAMVLSMTGWLYALGWVALKAI
jgi:hypothetical protein